MTLQKISHLKDLLAQLAHLYVFQVVAKAVLGGC